MKISLVYIAVTNGTKTVEFADRFLCTYGAYPPGASHETVVCCNGGPLSHEVAELFSELRPRFYPRVNDPGWDISGFMDASKSVCKDSDLVVCLGESCYFHKPGWLARIVEAWESNGPGLYGFFGSNVVRAHLQTNAFACAPSLFSQYQHPVNSRAARYEFEHGKSAFWRVVESRGFPVKLVTWDGEWDPRDWRKPANILWRGDQSNCLMWCRHTDRWAVLPNHRKSNWSVSADRPFK